MSYPQNAAAIGFDGKLTSEKVLNEFFAECGFSVA
jgi:methylmalonyl-CoA mutase cobalamin-binding subunit